MTQKFDPSVRIETERLVLRFLKIEDREAIHRNISGDSEVTQYFLMKNTEKAEDLPIDRFIKAYTEAEKYCFAIELKSTGEVIGWILQCSVPGMYFNSTEIGYAIGKAYWNKGYVTEALSAMIDFCKSLGIHKIYASHIVENAASGKVMEKCGMIYECTRIHDIEYHGKFWDTRYYYIINE